MKIVSFELDGSAGIGLLDEQRQTITPLIDRDGSPLGPRDVAGVVAATMPPGNAAGLRKGRQELPLHEVRLRAPLAHPPKNVFCVGKNYVEHSKEFDRSGYDASSGADSAPVPQFPIVFTKPHSAIVGPDDKIDPHSSLTQALDYEAEIAVIIGKGGAGIPADRAWEHVWGMTLVNDITARDLQQRHKQWFIGKSFDTFLPMGPWIASMDELRTSEIVLEGRVNGEVRQRASLTDLIFDIPTIIETISAGMSLEPGDVIATGTPAGVGIGFDPPQFLRPGDRLEVTATGLGTLQNTVGEARDLNVDSDTERLVKR